MKNYKGFMSFEEKIIYSISNSLMICDHCLNNLYYEEFSFERLKEISIKQKVFHLVYPKIKEIFKNKTPISFEIENTKNRINSQIILNQINEIHKKFTENKIKYAISKGIAISNYIYDNSYFRSMRDIDIVVFSKDYMKACHILKELGYKEFHFDIINKYLYNDVEDGDFYINNSDKCRFCRNNSINIEIKDKIQYVENYDLTLWLENTKEIIINNVVFYTFNLLSSFYNLLINSYKNLCCPYGIDHDYTIRDIMEIYIFMIKYKKQLSDSSKQILDDLSISFKIRAVLDIMYEFFSKESFNLLPEEFRKIKSNIYNHDFIIWKIGILERLFDSEKRVLEHKLFRIRNSINIEINKPTLITDYEEFYNLDFCLNCHNMLDNQFKYSIVGKMDKIIVKYYVPDCYENILIETKFLMNKNQYSLESICINYNSNHLDISGDTNSITFDIKKNNKNNIFILEFNKFDILQVTYNDCFFLSAFIYISQNKQNLCVAQLGNEYHFECFQISK